MSESNSGSVEQRLRELGHELPQAPTPAGSYVPAVRSGDLIFTAGQLPLVEGTPAYTGKVGDGVSNVSPEEAQKAAEICTLNALAAVESAGPGTLDRIRRVVKVTGFVASAPSFNGQPTVLNGASELLGEALGEAGLHARSAVGVAELPFDAPVEVELVVEISGD
ncbi:RidA family protein [Rubrobacter aplysinae]|uniref:RidA family protein n=1 Tax=Rubrobacter aplysinae TaxID=909625 RepID=UPI00064C1572|nr:RidA family protein [Rubrobacter aplysinae]